MLLSIKSSYIETKNPIAVEFHLRKLNYAETMVVVYFDDSSRRIEDIFSLPTPTITTAADTEARKFEPKDIQKGSI